MTAEVATRVETAPEMLLAGRSPALAAPAATAEPDWVAVTVVEGVSAVIVGTTVTIAEDVKEEAAELDADTAVSFKHEESELLPMVISLLQASLPRASATEMTADVPAAKVTFQVIEVLV